MHPLARILSVSALAATAAAQNLLPVYPPLVSLESGEATAGAFGPFVTARVSGLGLDDVAFVRAGRAFLTSAPGIFAGGASAMGGVPDGIVTDLRALPGVGPGGADAIAVVGSFGLGIWTLATSTGAGSFTLVDAAWSTVTRLQVGDLDGDGALECVGIRGDDATVRIASTVPPFVASTRTYADTVLAAVAVDYDPALPGDELGVVTTSGILVETGTAPVMPVAAYPLHSTAAHAVRLETTAGEYFVVWTDGDAGGGPQGSLLTMAKSVEPYVRADLLGQTPLCLVARDASMDGFDDLSLVFDGASTFETLLNRGVMPPQVPPTPAAPHLDYAPTGGVQVDLGTAFTVPVGGRVRPTPVDVDGDGDQDFIVGNADGLTLGVTTWHDADGMRPLLWSTVYTDPRQTEIAVGLVLPSPAGCTANHVELLRWPVVLPGNVPTIEPVAERLVLQSAVPGTYVSILVDCEAPLGGSSPHAGYFYAVRMVELDKGQRVRAYPARTFARPVPEQPWLAGAETWFKIGFVPGGEETGIVSPMNEPPPPPPPSTSQTSG